MGLTKSEIFTEEQNKMALIAKAFGHPARIAIIQHLFKINSCVCGDLVNEIGLAQPTISQHLKELKNLGIIKGSIEGTSVDRKSTRLNSSHVRISYAVFCLKKK